jgi:hypothetical protein
MNHQHAIPPEAPADSLQSEPELIGVALPVFGEGSFTAASILTRALESGLRRSGIGHQPPAAVFSEQWIALICQVSERNAAIRTLERILSDELRLNDWALAWFNRDEGAWLTLVGNPIQFEKLVTPDAFADCLNRLALRIDFINRVQAVLSLPNK